VSGDLRRLADLLHERGGLVLRDGQLGGLEAALRRLDPDLGPADLLGARDVAWRTATIDALIDATTVKETFFLRHLDELADVDWPALSAGAAAQGRRAVRVWSAGCATGEEAYTLALLAAEAGDVAVDVLGTDIAPSALTHARRGVYGARSLRLLGEDRRARWIEPHDRGGVVGHALRRPVRFAVHNLVADPTPPTGEGPFDLVVCRNVLIYFDAATVARTIARLRSAVTPTGTLVVGTADRLSELPARPAVLPPPTAAGVSPPPVRPPAPAPPARPEADPPEPPPAQRGALESAPAADAGALVAFEEGTATLGDGDAERAVVLLRRALYLDPAMAVAALQLGRAHELRGDPAAARHAYHRALRLAAAAGDPATLLYDRIGVSDVIAACDARLRELEPGPAAPGTGG